MSRVNWRAVQAADFSVPPDASLSDLTAELTTSLGSTDEAERERVARRILCTWIRRGVYDDLLGGLGDGMVAGHSRVSDEPGSAESQVFRRASCAVILRECIDRDTSRPLVAGGTVLSWGDRLTAWLLAERDLRDVIAGHGRARAVVHGARALAALAASPHLGAPELTVMLDVVGERSAAPAPHPFLAREPDALADVVLTVLHRDRVPADIVEAWLLRLAEEHRDSGRTSAEHAVADRNVESLLRAVYLRLAFSRRHPPQRADLMLGLVDALQSFEDGPPSDGQNGRHH
ncbi:DUF2785 domain-containing protein [Nocardioides sp. R-C-SC26]|uniref:DUF2785 domain-containing protein n=1 Tax=Nocardioides sp. R-C-SC26 TaxID=2870414 RepID=UPI001E3D0C06|nr:DUF2785 domain-containing protein [Nocardioides sp. R-C-SC26]